MGREGGRGGGGGGVGLTDEGVAGRTGEEEPSGNTQRLNEIPQVQFGKLLQTHRRQKDIQTQSGDRLIAANILIT